MSTQEQSRDLNTQQRHHDEHQQESMRYRTEFEVQKPNTLDDINEEQARELMTQERHHDEYQQASMLNRAEAEVGISGNNAASSQSQE